MKQPHCRYCGKPIAKLTNNMYLRKKSPTSYFIENDTNIAVDEYPTTREECAKYTNLQIVKISRWPDGTIHSFSTWDGERYKDQYFCKNECAIRMGYICVRSPHNLVTKDWLDATKEK